MRSGIFDRFFFVDNTFNLPLSYAKEFCDQLVKAKLNISWRCILYPWRVDEELVEKMSEAGCKEVSLGFESGSKDVLRAMNKRFDPDEVRRISSVLAKHGIRRMGFLLLGGPGETRKTDEERRAVIDCVCKVHHRTGVEMEALTGASIAALTVYDMCKALSHDIRIEETQLMAKSGGKKDFQRE